MPITALSGNTTSRLGRLVATLNAATPGSAWKLTRLRSGRADKLAKAVELARHEGLPVGVDAAPPAAHFSGEATTEVFFPPTD